MVAQIQWVNFVKFYERFKMLCEEIGKSLTGVGKEVGANNAAVNYWKEGHTPKHETLAKIAEYFNVSINYLVGESDNRKSGVINSDDIGNFQSLNCALNYFNR